MGQRLNTEIVRRDKVISATYYHWSGYTIPAIETTLDALEGLIRNKNTIDDLDMAVKAMENTGAGIAEDEKDEIPKGRNYKDAIDRNEGLIAITQDGINRTENAAEGDTAIIINKEGRDFNIDDTKNGDIDIDICGTIWFLDAEELKDSKGLEPKDLKIIPIDVENIDMDELQFLCDTLIQTDISIFRDIKGRIIQIIK